MESEEEKKKEEQLQEGEELGKEEEDIELIEQEEKQKKEEEEKKKEEEEIDENFKKLIELNLDLKHFESLKNCGIEYSKKDLEFFEKYSDIFEKYKKNIKKEKKDNKDFFSFTQCNEEDCFNNSKEFLKQLKKTISSLEKKIDVNITGRVNEKIAKKINKKNIMEYYLEVPQSENNIPSNITEYEEFIKKLNEDIEKLSKDLDKNLNDAVKQNKNLVDHCKHLVEECNKNLEIFKDKIVKVIPITNNDDECENLKEKRSVFEKHIKEFQKDLAKLEIKKEEKTADKLKDIKEKNNYLFQNSVKNITSILNNIIKAHTEQQKKIEQHTQQIYKKNCEKQIQQSEKIVDNWLKNAGVNISNINHNNVADVFKKLLYNNDPLNTLLDKINNVITGENITTVLEQLDLVWNVFKAMVSKTNGSTFEYDPVCGKSFEQCWLLLQKYEQKILPSIKSLDEYITSPNYSADEKRKYYNETNQKLKTFFDDIISTYVDIDESKLLKFNEKLMSFVYKHKATLSDLEWKQKSYERIKTFKSFVKEHDVKDILECLFDSSKEQLQKDKKNFDKINQCPCSSDDFKNIFFRILKIKEDNKEGKNLLAITFLNKIQKTFKELDENQDDYDLFLENFNKLFIMCTYEYDFFTRYITDKLPGKSCYGFGKDNLEYAGLIGVTFNTKMANFLKKIIKINQDPDNFIKFFTNSDNYIYDNKDTKEIIEDIKKTFDTINRFFKNLVFYGCKNLFYQDIENIDIGKICSINDIIMYFERRDELLSYAQQGKWDDLQKILADRFEIFNHLGDQKIYEFLVKILPVDKNQHNSHFNEVLKLAEIASTKEEIKQKINSIQNNNEDLLDKFSTTYPEINKIFPSDLNVEDKLNKIKETFNLNDNEIKKLKEHQMEVYKQYFKDTNIMLNAAIQQSADIMKIDINVKDNDMLETKIDNCKQMMEQLEAIKDSLNKVQLKTLQTNSEMKNYFKNYKLLDQYIDHLNSDIIKYQKQIKKNEQEVLHEQAEKYHSQNIVNNKSSAPVNISKQNNVKSSNNTTDNNYLQPFEKKQNKENEEEESQYEINMNETNATTNETKDTEAETDKETNNKTTNNTNNVTDRNDKERPEVNVLLAIILAILTVFIGLIIYISHIKAKQKAYDRRMASINNKTSNSLESTQNNKGL